MLMSSVGIHKNQDETLVPLHSGVERKVPFRGLVYSRDEPPADGNCPMPFPLLLNFPLLASTRPILVAWSPKTALRFAPKSRLLLCILLHESPPFSITET